MKSLIFICFIGKSIKVAARGHFVLDSFDEFKGLEFPSVSFKELVLELHPLET